LVCLLPLTAATRGIIDAALLAQLPRGAYVINVARGAHVVDEDLLAALDNGHLSGATLDVVNQEPLAPEHPYWAHPRVFLTPHIAGLTRAQAAAAQIADNIRRLQAGAPLLNRIDPARQY
jgi:glyoxylate/hydroxypyruvate reductase A